MIPADVPANVRFIKLSGPDIEGLVRRKLGIPVSLEQARKLCDLKPAFGKIFEDHLRDFPWWGYCDNDMVLGRLNGFLRPQYFEKYDIISTYPGYLSGPFSLYRNTEKIKLLFRLVPGHENIFMRPGCMGFDENLAGHPSGKKPSDLLLFPFFALDPENPNNLFRANFRELRYQYHWAVKRRRAVKNNIMDMSDLVYRLADEDTISPLFLDLMLSDSAFDRSGYRRWKMVWDQGVLKEEHSGREVFAFHFRMLKHRPDFAIQAFQPGITRFEISTDGIRY